LRKTLAFRFDVDSVRCIEEGIPRLIELGERRSVRFTFYVNMGRSFNWVHNLRYFASRRRRASRAARAPALPTYAKLGARGVLKTMFLNPVLGERYRGTFDRLHAAGHELGLHGGTDHVVWQRSLDDLSPNEVGALLRPAYEAFVRRYGRPAGFASPGFVHNDTVLRLMDRYGFAYGSDRPGEEPFRPSIEGVELDHFQVPVNVVGPSQVPIVEHMLATGHDEDEIVAACVEGITALDFALLYGHPYVEGVRAEILDAVISAVQESHEVVTVVQYLERWRRANDR
jgi:peptidoglycan/xylan/chitin deacetylase (PgdA/CDA1 family)